MNGSALRQFVVTLTGAVQNLGVLFPDEKLTPWVELRFTQQGGAAAQIGEADNPSGVALSATNYAVVAPASAAREAVLTARGGTKLKFKDIEVLGTNGQKLSIAAMTW